MVVVSMERDDIATILEIGRGQHVTFGCNHFDRSTQMQSNLGGGYDTGSKYALYSTDGGTWQIMALFDDTYD
eukprot:scaffold16835_cov44-Cylindrotheca_fusiformis.AAC.1